VGACEEGTGSAEFTKMLGEYTDAGAYLDDIAGKEVTIDQWQLEKLALVMQRATVLYCVPGLSEAVRRSLWSPAFAGIGEAVAALLEGLRPGSRVAVIPEGPYVLAKVAALV